MNNARKIVIDVLNEVFFGGAYSNIALNKALSSENIMQSDKALITEIVYGTIKYKYTIDVILKKFITIKLNKVDKNILNILRSSIYQIRYLDKVPDFAAVNEAVELAKKRVSFKSSKFVNGVLRNYLRNLNESFVEGRQYIEKLSFKYSFEPWMVKTFMQQYGSKEVENILGGLNLIPAVTVRVNSLRASYDEVWDKLCESGYEISEGEVCPEAIVIRKGGGVEKNPLFKEGYFTVQDESAMLTAPCLDIKEGMTIMDLCSAPGGKTTHIGEILNNTGVIYAFDIHENKLKLIEENANRLGVKNIKCSTLDASVYDEQFKEKADRILVDAPCSGLGIIRKKPEIKWTKKPQDLKELSGIQKKILDNAAKYVKKGGIILYSTCTLNTEENNNVISSFIKRNSNFSIEDIYFGEAKNLHYGKYGVTIFPSEQMDGFFMCKLRKL